MPIRRPAQDQRAPARQPARIESLPAPVRGWNTRDRMAVTIDDLLFAPVLENWMCIEGRLVMRPGYVEWATGLPTEEVETLFAYKSGTTAKLFAGCDAAIYEITASGAVGAAETGMTSLTNVQFQHVMFATTSGVYLVCVNGADGVRTYSGSAWATQSITGATAANFINVFSFKQRLWFVEKNTMKAWYLDPYAIAGAATVLNLGSIFRKGGSLVAINAISIDGGSGPDDYLVFLTDQGECAVYGGIDPSSSGTWGLVGVFATDKPLGFRCMSKLGGDVAILTESGVMLLSDIMSGAHESDHQGGGADSLSEPIRNEFIKAAGLSRSTFGWQIFQYTKRGWLVSNVPSNTGAFRQFIYNPLMRAWFPFAALNGFCWEQFDNAAFFGGEGVVYKWDDGSTADNGENIVSDIGYMPWNFNYPGHKSFVLAQPHYFTDAVITPEISMRVDYDDREPSNVVQASSAPLGSEWGDGGGGGDLWDDAVWGGGLAHYSRWLTLEGEGIMGAVRKRISSTTATVELASIDVAFIPGGIV